MGFLSSYVTGTYVAIVVGTALAAALTGPSVTAPRTSDGDGYNQVRRMLQGTAGCSWRPAAVLFAPVTLMVFFSLAAGGTEEFSDVLGLVVFSALVALVVMAFAAAAGPALPPPDGSTNDGFNQTPRLF